MLKPLLFLFLVPCFSFAQSAKDYMLKAKLKTDSAKFQEALELYDKALLIDPNSIEAHEKRAQLRMRFKDTRGALEDIDVALKEQPDNLKLFEERAMLKGLVHNFTDAIADLTYIINKNGTEYRFYMARAIFEGQNRDHKAAAADFGMAIALNNGNPALFKGRAYEEEALGNHQEAIEDFTQAINYKDKSLAQCYNARGNVKLLIKDFKGAIEDYSLSLSYEKSAGVYQNRGNAFFNLKQFKEAIADYTSCIELSENSQVPVFLKVVSYVQRGDAKDLNGDLPGAIADYNVAISIDPKAARAYAGRAKAEFDSNNKGAACADWQEAAKLQYKGAIIAPEKYCK